MSESIRDLVEGVVDGSISDENLISWLKQVHRDGITDAETIALVKTLGETHSPFFVLDTNANPVEIVDPEDFLQILIERNQEAISSYHQMSKTFEKRGD